MYRHLCRECGDYIVWRSGQATTELWLQIYTVVIPLMGGIWGRLPHNNPHTLLIDCSQCLHWLMPFCHCKWTNHSLVSHYIIPLTRWTLWWLWLWSCVPIPGSPYTGVPSVFVVEGPSYCLLYLICYHCIWVTFYSMEYELPENNCKLTLLFRIALSGKLIITPVRILYNI